MSKIKFNVTYDTESKKFICDYEKNCKLVHSGSSYLRIISNKIQIGTIGTQIPYPFDVDEQKLRFLTVTMG